MRSRVPDGGLEIKRSGKEIIMLPRSIITLAAAASLGAAVLASAPASARMGGGHGGGHAAMGGHFGGVRSASVVRGGTFRSNFVVRNRVIVNNRFPVRHHRFAFRHHRFAFAGGPVIVDDTCWRWWHGRRIWLCN
jgi:hypothetical protein